MCIDFRLKKMMIVEIVLVISDENTASPLGKGSIRKVQTWICKFRYCLFIDATISDDFTVI